MVLAMTLAVLVLVLGVGRAQAQPLPTTTRPAPAAQPVLVPPKLASPALVAYPEGAKGEALVVLSVTVNLDGTVRDARVSDGEEPFGSAAVEAAKTWRFEPATRAGQPVAATIRFEVAFKAPVVESETRTPTRTPVARAPKKPSAVVEEEGPVAPPEAEDFEVLVEEDRLAPNVQTITRAEVRQLPGAFGDPFRAIEMLPGVTPVVSGLPFFYVRGAPPGNVGYFLDNVRVPYLYHIALGPSVVHPALIDRVDLYSGGYPASYGRFAGGIVAGETKPPRPELHGEANIRLYDAGAIVESGFADGRGTVLVGGRYSYTAALFSLFVPRVTLDYRDFQTRVSYDLTPKNRLTLFSFGSFDLLGETKQGISKTIFGSEFYRADLRYDHFYDKDSSVRVAATFGFDQTKFDQRRNATDKVVGGRVEVRHRASKNVVVRAGVDTTVDFFGTGELRYSDPEDPEPIQLERIFPARSDIAFGGYLDLPMNVLPWIELTPGLRVDLFTQGGESAVGIDPRISARFSVTDDFRIVHSYGIVHQPPSFIVPIPGIVPATLNDGLQKSYQTAAGVEVDLPAKFTATATAFNNVFLDMTDALGTFNGDFEEINDRLEQRSTGRAIGLEFFLRRSLTERVGGFVGYTLSQSTRSIGRESFPSAFDRTHVANGAVAFDLGKNWRAGTRLLVYSGAPKIQPANNLIVGLRPSNPSRSPPFYRVDLRLEKKWIVWEKGWLAFVVEVLNATLSKETFGSEVSEDRQIGPITIPSIGVEGGF